MRFLEINTADEFRSALLFPKSPGYLVKNNFHDPLVGFAQDFCDDNIEMLLYGSSYFVDYHTASFETELHYDGITATSKARVPTSVLFEFLKNEAGNCNTQYLFKWH